jgi:hypothetical protein
MGDVQESDVTTANCAKARVVHRVFVWSILHRTSTKNHARIRANPKEVALVHCSGHLRTTQPCKAKLASSPVACDGASLISGLF